MQLQACWRLSLAVYDVLDVISSWPSSNLPLDY